ncbi:MAG TPA: hypothetical protein VD948_03445 [Rhodothermales bacterium]|nr:hypothetical protein [Rhodothermales bacterium]
MSFLTCKACGAEAVTPLEMDVEGGEGLLSDADEAHFYTCQVCGDNWLSVRRMPEGGTAELTFVHQMGMQPLLRRTALMNNAVVMSEASVDTWSYFLGDDEVDEEEWRDRLKERRHVLKAVCTN